MSDFSKKYGWPGDYKDIKTVRITIVGDTPLIYPKWSVKSDKTKQEVKP